MKRTQRYLLLIAALAAILSLPARASAESGPVPEVNQEFTIIDCGTPIEVLRLYASTVYKHPETGRLHLLLEYGNNNGYGIGEQEWEDTAHRLVDVDLDSGEIRRTKGSDGLTCSHSFHPNGRMYLFEGKTHPASFSEYDPRTGTYRRICAMSNAAYKVALAPSGRIYAGQVGGDVMIYDPQLGTATHYKEPAGRPAFWGVYTMEVEEPWVYCGMTNHGEWWLTVIDTRTGEAKSYFDDPPATSGGVARTEAGNLFFRNYLLKDGKPLVGDDGKPVRLDEPDRTERLPGNRPWPNMWRVSGYAGAQYDEPAAAGLQFDMTDAEPNNFNGGVATIRWRKQGEERWRTIEIRGLELIGSSAKCLAVAPNGTLVGVAQFYGSVFHFDPATGKSEKIGIAPGSVYQILPLEDHTYFCGYVAYMADYDHGKPYSMTDRKATFDEDTNPKRYRTEGKWTHAMELGPDGRIYLGGKYGRHKTGGGLSIFDPKTQEMRLIRELFEYLGVRGLFFIDGGKTLAITTTPVGEGGPEKGSIFLFDLAQQEFTAEVKLDQLEGDPDQLFVAGDTAVIGVSRHSQTDDSGGETHSTLVYGLDLASGKMLFEKRYPGRAFTGICEYDRTPLVRGSDGCGWLFLDEKLCRIHPDGTLETVREKMEYRGKMIWQGNTLYVYNGGRVYNRLFANVVRIPDLFQ
jgi:hypothetical protein